jgi:hypothetical protein
MTISYALVQELQRFGRSFLGHCRRKKMVLPKVGMAMMTSSVVTVK